MTAKNSTLAGRVSVFLWRFGTSDQPDGADRLPANRITVAITQHVSKRCLPRSGNMTEKNSTLAGWHGARLCVNVKNYSRICENVSKIRL